MKSLYTALTSLVVCGLIAAAGLLTFVPDRASAAYPPRGGQGSSAVGEARKAEKAAKDEVNRVKKDIKKLRDSIMKEMAAEDEWKGVADKHKKAKAAVAANEKRVKAALQKDAKYKKALAGKEKAAATRDAIKADPDADAAALTEAGNEVAKFVKMVSEMEADARENDQKLLEAKAALEKAEEQMKEFEEAVEAALEEHEEYAALETELETAEAAYEQAKATRVETAKSEAAARAAAREAERAQRESQRSSGGGGSRRRGGGGY